MTGNQEIQRRKHRIHTRDRCDTTGTDIGPLESQGKPRTSMVLGYPTVFMLLLVARLAIVIRSVPMFLVILPYMGFRLFSFSRLF